MNTSFHCTRASIIEGNESRERDRGQRKCACENAYSMKYKKPRSRLECRQSLVGIWIFSIIANEYAAWSWRERCYSCCLYVTKGRSYLMTYVKAQSGWRPDWQYIASQAFWRAKRIEGYIGSAKEWRPNISCVPRTTCPAVIVALEMRKEPCAQKYAINICQCTMPVQSAAYVAHGVRAHCFLLLSRYHHLDRRIQMRLSL